jgi:hypothetical protein
MMALKTAEEIKALQIAAGTYKAPSPKTPEPRAPLTFEEASASYRARQEELTTRLRRYSSISLLQRLELKYRAVAQKGGKCQICGYSKCMRALEFHHLDRRNKEFSIATFIGRKVFNNTVEKVWTAVVEELNKCVLLCANCHREVEAGVVDLPKIQ